MRNVHPTSQTTKPVSSADFFLGTSSVRSFPQAAPVGISGHYLNLRKLTADDFLSL